MDVNLSLPRLVIVPRALLIVDALGGHAPIATELRAAAREAVSTLVEDDNPEPVAIITGTPQANSASSTVATPSVAGTPGTPGSFKPFGVDCRVAAGTELPELLGRWLVEDALRARGRAISQASCACYESVSQALAAGATRALVLVDGAFGLGDDSPIGDVKQAHVTDALCRQIAGADAAAVSLEAACFPAPGDYAAEHWQQLAETEAGWVRDGARVVVKHVHYSGAPYGIGYHVASWRCEESL